MGFAWVHRRAAPGALSAAVRRTVGPRVSIWRYLLPLWALGLTGLTAAASAPVPPSPSTHPVLTEAALVARTQGAAAFLHQQIGADGAFTYRLDARTAAPVPGRYNLLRHAGALLALADYHRVHPPTPPQAAAIDAGWGFVLRCCLAPAGEDASALAVWSPPELTGGRRRAAVAKLGASGLTLAGLARWRLVQPAAVPLETLQALGRFIVSQQGDDGRFQSLHGLAADDVDRDWVSLYYPGEAILGLVLLFEQDPDPRWLAAAIDGLRHLARSREQMAHPPPDHWALMATAEVWRLPPAALSAALPPGFAWSDGAAGTTVAPLLRQHAIGIARSMLAGQIGPPAEACLQGGFNTEGRTTPSATRLEGLLALALVGVVPPRALDLRPGIEAGMAFLLAAQHLDGPVRHAFSRVSSACARTAARSHEVRIDYVQHALSALLMYQAWRPPGTQPPR